MYTFIHVKYFLRQGVFITYGSKSKTVNEANQLRRNNFVFKQNVPASIKLKFNSRENKELISIYSMSRQPVPVDVNI